MLNDLLIAFGVDSDIIPKLWQKPVLAENFKMSWGASPKVLSPIHATLDYYKKQLLPGERLDQFATSLFGHLDQSLRWGSLLSRYGRSTNRISLKDFCADILVDALSRSMFGNRIFELEPELIRCMIDFNDDAWMLIFKYPQAADSKLHISRRKLLEFFRRYMQSSAEFRRGQAWVIDKALQDLDAIDMRDEDKAPLLLMIYWG